MVFFSGIAVAAVAVAIVLLVVAAAFCLTPCLRPSDMVWCNLHERFLTGKEHLMSQGIFARGFALPAAVEDLSQKRTLAMSFAGKAFSATVLQANFLSHRMAFGERAARGHSPSHLHASIDAAKGAVATAAGYPLQQ